MEPSGDEKKEWSEREAEKGHVVEHTTCRSRTKADCKAGRGREEKKLAQISRGEWKPWLSGDQAPVQLCAAQARAPCMEGTGILFDPSCRPPSLPPSRCRLPCLFPRPRGARGRNQPTELYSRMIIIIIIIWKQIRQAVAWPIVAYVPSTKEAAAMPPCRPLVAGRFLQST